MIGNRDRNLVTPPDSAPAGTVESVAITLKVIELFDGAEVTPTTLPVRAT